MGSNWSTLSLGESGRVQDEENLAFALKGLFFLYTPSSRPPVPCFMTPSSVVAQFQTELFSHHFICIGLFSSSSYCSHGGLGLDLFNCGDGKNVNKWLSGKKFLVRSVCRFLRCKNLPLWPISNYQWDVAEAKKRCAKSALMSQY